MSESKLKPEELAGTIKYKTPRKGWMDSPVELKKGAYNYSGNPQSVEYLGLPNPRKWQPADPDWKLPENW